MSYINILSLILLYWLVIILLDRRGVLKRYNITAIGPILMIRTTRGQRLLDKIARPKKFWRIFANIGTPAMLIGMFIMFALIILMDYFLFSQVQTQTIPPPGKFNEPRNVFLIPGVNQFIPIEWGMIGLIVTLIVHEFSHAILCKVEGITVKSMGILFPIGGFAEPDEEQLLGIKKEGEKEGEKRVATRSERVRVLTSGVMANFVTALVAFTLFFFLLGTIAPVGEVMIVDVAEGSIARDAGINSRTILKQIDNTSIQNSQDFLAYMKEVKPGSNITLHLIDGGAQKNLTLSYTGRENEPLSGVEITRISNAFASSAGLKEGMIITKMDNTTISSSQDYFNYLISLKPETNMTLTVLDGTQEKHITFKTSSLEGKAPGLKIIEIIKDSPAEAAGLKKGMIITQIDNTTIIFLGDFARFMNSTHPDQVVSVYAKSEINATPMIFNITLAGHPDKNIKKGFLGVSYNLAETNLGIEVRDLIIALGISIGEFPARSYLQSLQKIPSMLTSAMGWIIIFGLPLFGASGEGFPGFSGMLAQFYQPIGWAEPLGIGVFWILNSLLWIGWLNFYVGLFNCLPAIPLDGGHVFRDVMQSLLERFVGNGKRVEYISNAIVYAFALLILASFVFMFLAPYLVHGF